jgi:hypothetical protein
MSTEGATPSDGGSADPAASRRERPVEERAEEIVELVSEQAVRFARRLFARAREELEDIVAEAQNLRRGEPPRE